MRVLPLLSLLGRDFKTNEDVRGRSSRLRIWQLINTIFCWTQSAFKLCTDTTMQRRSEGCLLPEITSVGGHNLLLRVVRADRICSFSLDLNR